VTALGSIRIEECVTRVLELPITKVVGPAVPVALCHDVYSYRVTNIDFHDAIGCGITLFELPNNLGLPLSNVQGHAVNAGGPINWQVGTGSPNIVWTALGNDPDGILPGEYGIFTYTVGCPSTDVQVTGHVNTCSLWPMPEIETAKLGAGYEVNTTGPGGIPNLMIYLNPEIAVTCTCSPSEGFLKCTVTVGVVIKNTGTDAVYTPFDVSMAITDPSNTSNVWAVCTQVFSGPIPFLQGNTHAVFATLSCTFDCHPPVTCLCPPTPAFGVVVTVDSGGVVTESNESDNFAATRGCCQEALPK
jgi:hypothetical protein